jgi:outer membrane lipoprotein LolB
VWTSDAWRAWWLVLLLAGGCASVPAPPDALSGRLAVRVEAAPPKSVSTQFELRGDAARGELTLTTALGTTLARARWQPGDVQLITPDGEQRFADLDALAQETLGERLPLGALFDWLRGRPWSGAPSTPLPVGFEQLGWRVDVARYADGVVDASRAAAPAVTVRARLDARGAP